MKETFYFTHDYNARSDEKIKRLIRIHWMQWYWVFWSIVEDLYQNANEMVLDFDLLSYDYRIDVGIVKSVVEDFGIFTFKDWKFWSKSVEKRLSERDSKSKKARDNARKRWGENESRIKASECIFYVIKLKSDDESFIKCWITTESISRRYSGKTDIYSYDVIYQKEVSVEKGIEIENKIKESIQSYSPRNKFAWYLECYDEENLSNILNIAMQNDCNGIAKNEIGNAIKEKKRKEIKENNTEIVATQPNEYLLSINYLKNYSLETEIPEYAEKYRDEWIKFCIYWWEKGKTGKIRAEWEKTFEIKKRFATWMSRKKDQYQQKQKESALDITL